MAARFTKQYGATLQLQRGGNKKRFPQHWDTVQALLLTNQYVCINATFLKTLMPVNQEAWSFFEAQP